MLRHTTLCAFVVVILAMGSTYARDPDGACDGLQDNAWGLCNAYCYAMDCDGDRNASGRACSQVAANFMRATGNEVPCAVQPSSPTESPVGSCPCNFDLQHWTGQPQILPALHLPICTGTANEGTCITCGINSMSSSTTFLSVLVNLWTDGFSSQEDRLFFFTTEPSTLLGGSCGADASFSSGDSFTTPGGELPVTDQEFGACASDIEALQNTYAAMCNR